MWIFSDNDDEGSSDDSNTNKNNGIVLELQNSMSTDETNSTIGVKDELLRKILHIMSSDGGTSRDSGTVSETSGGSSNYST